MNDVPTPVYSNCMSVAGREHEAVLQFRLQMPGDDADPSTSPVVATVITSWTHLKALLPVLADQVAQYEALRGEIPAPTFKENHGG